jgi:hypothetical protein
MTHRVLKAGLCLFNHQPFTTHFPIPHILNQEEKPICLRNSIRFLLA